MGIENSRKSSKNKKSSEEKRRGLLETINRIHPDLEQKESSSEDDPHE